LEGEGVAQVVGPQGRDAVGGIAHLGVAPAADLLQDLIVRAHREAPVRGARRQSPCAQEERGCFLVGISRPLLLEIIGEGQPCVPGEEHRPLGVALPPDSRDAAAAGLVHSRRGTRLDLVEV
jgi:hypothetical protein